MRSTLMLGEDVQNEERSTPGEIWLGTMGFSYERWVGTFYPPGTTSRDYLTEYARRLALVELDTTYYRSPPPEQVERWAESTPPEFRFAAKVPKSITQERKLAGVGRDLDYFFDAMRRFG